MYIIGPILACSCMPDLWTMQRAQRAPCMVWHDCVFGCCPLLQAKPPTPCCMLDLGQGTYFDKREKVPSLLLQVPNPFNLDLSLFTATASASASPGKQGGGFPIGGPRQHGNVHCCCPYQQLVRAPPALHH